MKKDSKFIAFLKEYKLVIFLFILFLMILCGIGWYFLNMYSVKEDKDVKYESFDVVSDEPLGENPDNEVDSIRKEQERAKVDEVMQEAYDAKQEGAEATPIPEETPEPSATPKPTRKPKRPKLTKGQKAFLEREKQRKKSKRK